MEKSLLTEKSRAEKVLGKKKEKEKEKNKPKEERKSTIL